MIALKKRVSKDEDEFFPTKHLKLLRFVQHFACLTNNFINFRGRKKFQVIFCFLFPPRLCPFTIICRRRFEAKRRLMINFVLLSEVAHRVESQLGILLFSHPNSATTAGLEWLALGAHNAEWI